MVKSWQHKSCVTRLLMWGHLFKTSWQQWFSLCVWSPGSLHNLTQQIMTQDVEESCYLSKFWPFFAKQVLRHVKSCYCSGKMILQNALGILQQEGFCVCCTFFIFTHTFARLTVYMPQSRWNIRFWLTFYFVMVQNSKSPIVMSILHTVWNTLKYYFKMSKLTLLMSIASSFQIILSV